MGGLTLTRAVSACKCARVRMAVKTIVAAVRTFDFRPRPARVTPECVRPPRDTLTAYFFVFVVSIKGAPSCQGTQPELRSLLLSVFVVSVKGSLSCQGT